MPEVILTGYSQETDLSDSTGRVKSVLVFNEGGLRIEVSETDLRKVIAFTRVGLEEVGTNRIQLSPTTPNTEPGEVSQHWDPDEEDDLDEWGNLQI